MLLLMALPNLILYFSEQWDSHPETVTLREEQLKHIAVAEGKVVNVHTESEDSEESDSSGIIDNSNAFAVLGVDD